MTPRAASTEAATSYPKFRELLSFVKEAEQNVIAFQIVNAGSGDLLMTSDLHTDDRRPEGNPQISKAIRCHRIGKTAMEVSAR